MTPPAKWLPESAAQFPSIRYFRDQVEVRLDKEAQKQGVATPSFDLGKVQVVDGQTGDDLFELQYQDEGLNLGLVGMVQTNRHELSLWKFPLNEPLSRKHLAYLEMQDACSLSKALVGSGDLKDNCRDGVVEPKIVAAAEKFPTLQAFDHFCRDSYQSYLGKNPELRRSGNYDLKRTQILNPEKGNFAFDLLYENPANAFYCRGHASTLGSQRFLMTSGSRQEFAAAPEAQYLQEGVFTKEPQVHKMNDACRLTTALVGADEFHGDCQEWTDGERAGVKAMGYLGTGLEYAFFGMLGYDGVAGVTRGVDWVFKTKLHPASFGKWGSPSAWVTRKSWGMMRWSFVNAYRFGTAALGSAKLGLAAWNVTSVSAASTGSIGLACAVGFVGGFAIGTGLEKAQQWAFGNSLSGLAGDAAFRTFGPAKPSTIDWFDKWFGWLP